MDKTTIIVNKIKAQLSKFSGIISKDFPKTKRRVIIDSCFRRNDS